jgi:hypothetical protein
MEPEDINVFLRDFALIRKVLSDAICRREPSVQAFLSQAFLRYVCCPTAPVPPNRRVVATAALVKAGMPTVARASRIVSVSIVLFLVTG